MFDTIKRDVKSTDARNARLTLTDATPAHPRSEQTINPALQVFKVPLTDVSINPYRMVTIQPLTTGINPMEFLIHALDDYVDLSRSYFTVELTLKKNNGTDIATADKLWVTNNLAHTLFKQISMRLNGTLISPQTDTYHYKAYLETLLNYNREDGKTVLKPQGWFNQLDFPVQWTATNTDSETPHAHYLALPANQKAALAASASQMTNYTDGKMHLLIFQLHLETFHTGKLLVPQVEIRMRLHFNSPDLFLNGVALKGRLTDNDIKVKFHLCQLRLNETIYMNLSEARHNKREVAAYPTVRSEIRTFSMQGNQARFEANNLFQGRIPDRIIVGMVRNEAFSGNVAFDPFCFQKFGLISIKQIVRGEEYPYERLQLNHNDGQRDLAGYFRFLQASGAWCKKQGNMARREDWGQGKNCTLFMFDNMANGCADSNALNPRQTGDLQLILVFGDASGHNKPHHLWRV